MLIFSFVKVATSCHDFCCHKSGENSSNSVTGLNDVVTHPQLVGRDLRDTRGTVLK